MKPSPTRGLTLLVAAVGGGWMVLDGLVALATGGYIGSELGPWAVLVGLVGVDPLSFGMRLFFVLYGLAWLGAALLYALRPAPGRWALLAFALGSLWYAVIGTAVSTTLALLLLTERHAPEPPPT